jgi:predicted dehydrogenase
MISEGAPVEADAPVPVGGDAMTRFRIAVIGAGSVSRFWLDALRLRPDVEVVAVVDPNAAAGDALIARYGLACERHDRVEDGIAAGANLVVNLTPPPLHRPVVETALRAGCDVLGEKPLATSMQEAWELVEIARETGRTYAVMQNRRFAPGIRTLRRGIEEGLIGEVTMLAADLFIGPHPEPEREWLTTMESPLLIDMSIHLFDQARFLAGGRAVRVFCDEFNPVGSWFAGNAAAVATVHFDNGVVFSYRGSWVAEGLATSWNGDWRVCGTKGSARWSGHGAPVGERVAASSPAPWHFLLEVEPIPFGPTPYERDENHQAEALDALLDALAAGERPETHVEDNVESLALVFAAIESARRGEPVDVQASPPAPAARS